jgi:hypothetical protein
MNRGTILLLTTSFVQVVIPFPAHADWYLASHLEDFGSGFVVELAKPCERSSYEDFEGARHPLAPADLASQKGFRLIDEGDKGVLVMFDSPTGGYVATERFFRTVEACKAFLARIQQEGQDRQREREKALAPYR